MPETSGSTGSALLGPAIIAGAGLLSNGINAGSQANMNRKNREFATQMYERQRADALADRDFQNEYSSPAAQMARLKAAGLNPNLVYGNGAAQTQSAPTRASNYSSPDTKAPQVDSGFTKDAIAAYYDAKLKMAQTDNIKALTEVAAKTAALTVANTVKAKAETMATGMEFLKKGVEAAFTSQQASQQAKSFPLTLATMEQQLRKLEADTKFTLNSDQRAAAMNAKSIQEATARILKMDYENARTQAEKDKIRVEINNVWTDGQIKALDLKLKQLGIQPGDNYFMRVLQQVMAKMPTWDGTLFGK